MWPGSEAIGATPDYYLEFSNSMSLTQKCDQIIEWEENHNLDLYMIYVPEIDEIGHIYGVDSKEVN